jgi:hypothetical protein
MRLVLTESTGKAASTLAPLVLGIVLIGSSIAWPFYTTRSPIFPRRLFTVRAAVIRPSLCD